MGESGLEEYAPIGPDDLAGQFTGRLARTEWLGPQGGAFSTPAAGADFAPFTIANRAFQVLTLFGQLVTSAAVANRAPQILYQLPSGETLMRVPQPAVVTASLTTRFSWGIGLVSQTLLALDEAQSIPEVWLPPGSKVSIVTGSLDVADQWSLGSVLYFMR